MADKFRPEKRSAIMASVRSSGNGSTEQRLLVILRENRIRGWRRNASVSGRPDFVFPAARLAVFVDGCFWHGCKRHCRQPKSNIPYWTGKILRNRKRDRVVGRTLRALGWTV